MRARFWATPLIALVVSSAACDLRTDPATNVTSNSATLNGHGACDRGNTCTYRGAYRKAGTSSWTYLPVKTVTGDGTSKTDSVTVHGLTPATTYEYIVCGQVSGDDSSKACVDSNGANLGAAPQPNSNHTLTTFTTLAARRP